MSFFLKLEELSEKFIEGIFKGKDASLQPVEIAKALTKEMEKKQELSISRSYVPNTYQVFLNPKDKVKLASLEKTLSKDLIGHLESHAKEQGFFLAGKLSVEILEEEEVKSGHFKLESSFSEDLALEEKSGEEGILPAEEKAFSTQIFDKVEITKEVFTKERGELVVIRGEDEGMIFPLTSFPLYMGRSKTNGIFIDDANVSRKHALIDLIKGSFYITDLNSLNGTFVNEEEIAKKKLEPGEHIKIGTTILEFRVVSK